MKKEKFEELVRGTEFKNIKLAAGGFLVPGLPQFLFGDYSIENILREHERKISKLSDELTELSLKVRGPTNGLKPDAVIFDELKVTDLKIKANDVIVEEVGDPWVCETRKDVPLNGVIRKLEKDIRRIQSQPVINTSELQFIVKNFIKLLHVLKQELKINIDEWDYEKPAIKLVKKDKEKE